MVTFLVRQPWRDAQRWHAEELWQAATITSLLNDAVAARPDATALIDRFRSVTWAQVRDAAARVAVELCELGVEPGDVVVLQLADAAPTLPVRVAIDAVGAVCAPLSHRLGPNEVAAVVSRTTARCYIGAADAATPTPFRLDVDPSNEELWEGCDAPLPAAGRIPDPDAVSDLMFTSGTTGRPKGVMNSANTKLAGLRGLLSCFDFGPEDVWGVVAPLSHNAGWLYTMLPALATGATSAIMSRGDAARILDAFDEHRVTATFLVPAHLLDLLHATQREPGRWALALRYVLTGAAAATPDAVRGVVAQWGAVPVSLYGMTECQANLFTRPGDPLEVVATTVGRACPTSEVALRSPADGSISTAPGSIGEIVTRGPTTFLGYYDDQSATAASFTPGGWFRSGDLAVLDDGNVRVVGRLKEVIVRGGATIVPEDVEAACAALVDGDVAAVGLPDERLGERLCLCVAGAVPVLDQLKKDLEQAGVGRHLWPDDLVVVDDFPRTELGKVQRSKLRALILTQDA